MKIHSREKKSSQKKVLIFFPNFLLSFQSLYGTRVDRCNYKDSRCILSKDSLIGFGCNTVSKRIKDKTDKRYYVYRITIGNDLNLSEPIEISDGSDDEADNMFDDAVDVGNETDDEPSDEEEDRKPDIHCLMRMAQEQMQIKQEVEGHCYDYDRTTNQQTEPIIENENPICLDSDEEKEDIQLVEPPRKRVRQQNPEFLLTTPEPEPQPEPEPKDSSDDLTDEESEQTIPEYQISDTILKEKVKLVQRSRGQYLATDMLKPQKKLLKSINNPPVHPKGNRSNGSQTPLQPEPSTSSWSNNSNYNTESDYKNFSIADLNNAFISEITKWDYRWIHDQKPNPLRYQMNVQYLDTNFRDLASFQRFE